MGRVRVCRSPEGAPPALCLGQPMVHQKLLAVLKAKFIVRRASQEAFTAGVNVSTCLLVYTKIFKD